MILIGWFDSNKIWLFTSLHQQGNRLHMDHNVFNQCYLSIIKYKVRLVLFDLVCVVETDFSSE